ncbi:hypothetical protein BH10CHL1_BH10CHL1_07340 [soil metagenome]
MDAEQISLHAPNPAEIWRTPIAADVYKSMEKWLAWSLVGERAVTYFSIYQGNRIVGQIFLHDGDSQTGESLIGYHLFQPQDRGRGIGTQALTLLLKYAVEQTNFTQLVIITDVDNQASRRIAEKCGFVYSGPAREGLPLICYQWHRNELR